MSAALPMPAAQDQPVRVDRIRLVGDLVDRIDEPFLRRGGGHALRDILVGGGRAELGRQVLLARDALARNPVVEEIRAPVHLDRDVGLHGDRLFQPALADEAPGTDHVGNDVDANGQAVGHGTAPKCAVVPGRELKRANPESRRKV